MPIGRWYFDKICLINFQFFSKRAEQLITGKMKIFPLSEGSFTVDQTKEFIPFQKNEDRLEERAKGSLLVQIQPFSVVTAKDILLLDTGLGFTGQDGKLQIQQNLASHGINSSDVTKVLMSHLHKDHSGGIEFNDNSELSFPNAIYYINEHEWNFAFQKGLPTYKVDDFLILKNSAQLQLINGNGFIDNYIEYEVTGAHSPFHQVFKIKEGGEIVFFGGDVAPQLQQLNNRFKAKYDYNGEKAMQLRSLWRREGAEKKWMFLFYHDIKSPVHTF